MAETASDATEIFKMPTADATVPDLMGSTRPQHPTLTIVKGPQTGQTFELDSPTITLGRDPKNSVFLNDMTVSRHHARMDLSNVGSAGLRDGSTVQIGTFRMVFHTNARARRIDTEA